MNLSNILKQKKITQNLEEKIKQSIDATSAYLRTVNQGNEEAIEAFEKATQQTRQEEKKKITFNYPTRTVQEADIDHHRRIHEQELAYKQELQQWNERNRAGNQRVAPPGVELDPEDRRHDQQPPTYIKPTSNVIKTGNTYMELKLDRQLNRDTMTYEWVRQDTEILERPENGDISMEDNSISYENKEKTKIDWEQTLQNLKDNGEKLGYSKKHYLKCLLRIMNQNEDDRYFTYKEETCPEKIANSLLSRYIGMNKKKLFENKLKALTRTKGQPIREVMCQADVLADRILHKCKDPQEKAYRKHQIMMDALKSFSSDENARELMQALRGSALSGERPDIEDLIDTVELAERVNESSRPDKEKTFMNEKTAEKCEVFTINTEGVSNNNTRPRPQETSSSLERAIQQTKEMSIRGREQRRNPREQRTPDTGPNRYPSRDRYTRDNSQARSYNSDERKGRNYEENRNRTYDRDSNNPDYNSFSSRDREGRPRDTSRRDWRDQNQTREEYRSYEKGNREANNSRYGDRNNTRYRNNSGQRDNRGYRDDSRPREYRRQRDDSRSKEYPRFRDNSRSGDNPRFRDYSRQRENTRSRDSSNNHRGGSRENPRNFRSQSRDRNTWKTVPQHKRNLEGVEFPPKTLMDLTVRFCVKCHNTLEEHYPWDCKLYRYWSNSPCDICYNGQHKSKECRKNPNRVDAFTMMLENTQSQKTDQMKSTYTLF